MYHVSTFKARASTKLQNVDLSCVRPSALLFLLLLTRECLLNAFQATGHAMHHFIPSRSDCGDNKPFKLPGRQQTSATIHHPPPWGRHTEERHKVHRISWQQELNSDNKLHIINPSIGTTSTIQVDTWQQQTKNVKVQIKYNGCG